MRMIENRIKHIADELAFKTWFHRRRIFETMTADELEAYAVTGQWHDRPEPTFGMSRLDSMDRTSLIKLWKVDMQRFAGRTGEELEFYAIHGRWPEYALEEKQLPSP